MKEYAHILAKSLETGGLPLVKHLEQVANATTHIAKQIGLNEETARKGAILHDIGKVSPLFQQTLSKNF